MSVPGSGFKSEVVACRKVVAHGTGEADRKESGPNNNMEAMKSCCDEEDRSIYPICNGKSSAVVLF